MKVSKFVNLTFLTNGGSIMIAKLVSKYKKTGVMPSVVSIVLERDVFGRPTKLGWECAVVKDGKRMYMNVPFKTDVREALEKLVAYSG